MKDQIMIEIKVIAVGKNKKIYRKHIHYYYCSTVPRAGDFISIQYWEVEVISVVWDIYDKPKEGGKVKASVYVDVSEIENEIRFD